MKKNYTITTYFCKFSLSKFTQNLAHAFIFPSRYLDDLPQIDKSYFEKLMSLDISTKLKLNKANKMDTEAPFISDVDVSITNILVSSKAYDKRGDLNFNSFLIFRPLLPLVHTYTFRIGVYLLDFF